jgi:hypothetical protein
MMLTGLRENATHEGYHDKPQFGTHRIRSSLYTNYMNAAVAAFAGAVARIRAKKAAWRCHTHAQSSPRAPVPHHADHSYLFLLRARSGSNKRLQASKHMQLRERQSLRQRPRNGNQQYAIKEHACKWCGAVKQARA